MQIGIFLVAIAGCALCTSALAADAPKDDAPAKPALVDLNSASVEELGKLEGITAARAAAIVDKRCYTAGSDIVDRRIVPKAVYEKIKDQISAGDRCVKNEAAASAAKSDAKADGGK